MRRSEGKQTPTLAKTPSRREGAFTTEAPRTQRGPCRCERQRGNPSEPRATRAEPRATAMKPRRAQRTRRETDGLTQRRQAAEKRVSPQIHTDGHGFDPVLASDSAAIPPSHERRGPSPERRHSHREGHEGSPNHQSSIINNQFQRATKANELLHGKTQTCRVGRAHRHRCARSKSVSYPHNE